MDIPIPAKAKPMIENKVNTAQALRGNKFIINSGKTKADNAEKNFVNTFTNHGVPDDVETTKVKKGSLLIDVLSEKGVVSSKGEFRRLVGEGAIKNAETEEKIMEVDAVFKDSITLKVGKRRFLKVEVN